MTTPKEIEQLIDSAGMKAGWCANGTPWYEPDAGALVPKLVDAILAQQIEIRTLRTAVVNGTSEREQQRDLLRAVDSLLVDVIALVSRAGVQKDALDEALGTRAAIHERQTMPPPPSGEIERAS